MLNWHWPTKQRYVDMKLGPQSKDYDADHSQATNGFGQKI